MKKPLVSVFCLFLFILSSPSAQIAKEPKVITINSVRVMEVFKKENKAQYSTKPDKTDKKKDTNSSEDKTESPTEQTAGTENISDTQTSVTTEEAQKAVEEKKDDIIVFTGGVSLSVKDGSTVSTIESDKLVYNRSENTIEAEGNVHYSRKSGGSDGAGEIIGELLLFNIDEMEGIFLDGTIKQAPRKQGQSPFTIQSATVGRDSSGVIGFKDAVLSTNPDPDEEPLWSIRASRIWMLPGNELAFANGYFSIGIVPILYLPFFYHPADEMLFHPVFGFRNREGEAGDDRAHSRSKHLAALRICGKWHVPPRQGKCPYLWQGLRFGDDEQGYLLHW